jgi:DNA/RNA endonuclease YhcR with UshA esterase domain
MVASEVVSVVGLSRFFRACVVSLNRSLDFKAHATRSFESHSINEHIFHHYYKIRDDVKLGDIKVLQRTYKSKCGRSID